jgi:hypothetical protein
VAGPGGEPIDHQIDAASSLQAQLAAVDVIAMVAANYSR